MFHRSLCLAALLFSCEASSPAVENEKPASPEQNPTQTATLPEARIVPFGGVPGLSINGVPQTPIMRAGYRVDEYAAFGKIGVRLFSPILTASAGFWEKPVWIAPDTWDYSRVDSVLEKIVAASPNARAFLRLELSAPAWWGEKYPDEMVRMQDADGKIVPLMLPKATPGGPPSHTVPSYASEVWRRDTEQALANLVHHIESGPYANCVIGYMPCSGTTEEWFQWGYVPDCSQPNLVSFRRWLKKRYPTVADLQEAWNSPSVDFDNAMPPSSQQVAEAGWGSMRNPHTERQVIDFQTFASSVSSEAMELFGRAIKKASSHSVLVGVPYGYLLVSDPGWGHQDIDKIVRSPDIDFMYSPTLYWEHRKLGEASPGAMSPLGTVRLHGKAWFSETDLRTSLTGSSSDWFQAQVSGHAEDVLFQRRELAWVLSEGIGTWWFDVGHIRYDSDELMEELGRLNRIAEANLKVSRLPEDQAVTVLDPNSVYYLPPRDRMLSELRRLQADKLGRTGMASANYSSGDLSQLQDKKLILFPDMISPTAETRKAVENLKSNGRVLVFFWADGAVSDKGFSEQGMEDLTGIHIRPMMEGTDLQVILEDCGGKAPHLKGTAYGPGRKVAPVFLPDDPEAEVWGRLATGEAALVVKRYKNWTAVYSSAPLLSPEVLALLGKEAGIHQYLAAGDAFRASEGLIDITAFTPGKKILRFKTPVSLYDLYEDRDLGTRETFEIPFQANETKLLRRGL